MNKIWVLFNNYDNTKAEIVNYNSDMVFSKKLIFNGINSFIPKFIAYFKSSNLELIDFGSNYKEIF